MVGNGALDSDADYYRNGSEPDDLDDDVVKNNPTSSLDEDKSDHNDRPKPATRKRWLRRLHENRAGQSYSSSRVTALLQLWRSLRDRYPREKVVVFLSSLRSLDNLSLAIERGFAVTTYRYDGTPMRGSP